MIAITTAQFFHSRIFWQKKLPTSWLIEGSVSNPIKFTSIFITLHTNDANDKAQQFDKD
jgi:hypothetical protein